MAGGRWPDESFARPGITNYEGGRGGGAGPDLSLITGLFSATGRIPSLMPNLALIACEIQRRVCGVELRRYSEILRDLFSEILIE